MPKLPNWQVLEFEVRAFWAVANSRLELRLAPDQPQLWELDVLNSVVENAEQIEMRFEPATGRVVSLSRVSRGKGQRLKTYEYKPDYVLRERRNPGTDPSLPQNQWPVSNSRHVPYPAMGDKPLPTVSSAYILVLLAERLQAQGENQSQDVLVHTDLNFYRVRMTSGNGGPIDVDYQKNGGDYVKARLETSAVALHVTPVGTQQEGPDFSLFGMQGDIILLFDRSSGLPLQVRGTAPRIGDTAINLKAVTLRESAQ
jgi:hypothetical protein